MDTPVIDGRTLRYQHRRGELLDAIGEYVVENGVANLSLRRVAGAVGVNHATLQHHFGSKEQLVTEIVEHVLERTLLPRGPDGERPRADMDLRARWRAFWASLTSAQGQRDVCLFIEVVGRSHFEGAGYALAVKRSIDRRLERLTTNLIGLGCPESEATTIATFVAATLRGLAIDLLATGERERVDAAFERSLDLLLDETAEWSANALLAFAAQ